jgi:pimeloyl-ACP methyl ester carboxylesterase
MLPDTLLMRLALNAFIFALTAIAPIALLHHLLHLVHESPILPKQAPYFSEQFLSILHYWLGIELLFYVYFLTARRRLQKRSYYVDMSAHERIELWQKCLATCPDWEEWLLGWFQPTTKASGVSLQIKDLRYDNVREWLCWAFFGRTIQEVEERQRTRHQLKQMMNMLESKCCYKFPAGYNRNIRTFRLNLDPLHAVHRPWIFYAVVFIIDWLGKMLLRAAGFQRYGREPRNLATLISGLLGTGYGQDLEVLFDGTEHERQARHYDGSSSSKITYWYRPGAETVDPTKAPLPIVFVHGIGTGLAPYLGFVWNILRAADRSTPCYLIELPHVSMRFHEHAPTVPETVREIKSALYAHGHQQAVFVAHSIGSIVVAGMCRWSRKQVAAVVLIDPICFMLHLPAVAYHFVHRPPRRANERFVNYFASRELFISHYISRHFQWYHACLWAEDLPGTDQTSVYLSEKDLLVPSLKVADYLRDRGVDQQLMPLDHAQFLFSPRWQQSIVADVVRYTQRHPSRICKTRTSE